MPAESSGDRSVNRVVSTGVVTRRMTNPKNPISAAVTATIAITRDAPRLLRKPARPCNEPAPQDSAARADWAIIAYGMVSIWLMKIKGAGNCRARKKSAFRGKADFRKIASYRAPDAAQRAVL